MGSDSAIYNNITAKSRTINSVRLILSCLRVKIEEKPNFLLTIKLIRITLKDQKNLLPSPFIPNNDYPPNKFKYVHK